MGERKKASHSLTSTSSPVSRIPTALVSKNRPDTVGQPQSTENCAAYLPSLQVQEHGESDTVTTAVWR
jgi:hypothetical protein